MQIQMRSGCAFMLIPRWSLMMMMVMMMMMIRDDDDHDDADDDEEDDAEDDNHGMVIFCRFAFFTFLTTLELTCRVHTRRHIRAAFHPKKNKQHHCKEKSAHPSSRLLSPLGVAPNYLAPSLAATPRRYQLYSKQSGFFNASVNMSTI